jgi:hypothetical protein
MHDIEMHPVSDGGWRTPAHDAAARILASPPIWDLLTAGQAYRNKHGTL